MKRHVTLLIFIFCLTILLLGAMPLPVRAQAGATSTPMPIPSATNPPSQPDANAKISGLDDRVKAVEDKILPFWLWMMGLTVLGVGSPLAIVQLAVKYHKKKLREAFYQADPRNFPVYIPKRNFETERKNLERLGFRSLRPYEFFPEVGERGIVIYHITGKDFDRDPNAKAQMTQELEDLKYFVEENKDKPLAYIIYINGQPKEVGDFIAAAGNVASANMPVTIAGHIYTLSRSLMD